MLLPLLMQVGMFGGVSITAAQGAYTTTGVDATLDLGKGIAAAEGAFVHAGVDADFVYTQPASITADEGAFAWTGINADLAFSGQEAEVVTPRGGSSKKRRKKIKFLYQREWKKKLEEIYRAVSGEPELADEVHEVVERFVKPSRLEDTELTRIPAIAIDWKKLRRDVDAVQEIIDLYARQVEDEEEAAVMLLLM